VTGRILAVTKGSVVDAVAAWDTTDNIMRLVLGRNAPTTGTVTVEIRGLTTNGARATITGRAIPSSNADVAPAPMQTLNGNATVSAGTLTFDIPDLGAYGAYAVDIAGLGAPTAVQRGHRQPASVVRGSPSDAARIALFDLQGRALHLPGSGIVIMGRNGALTRSVRSTRKDLHWQLRMDDFFPGVQ